MSSAERSSSSRSSDASSRSNSGWSGATWAKSGLNWPHGWGINTAFSERFNLTLRPHGPALGQRVLAYAQSETGRSRQLALVYLYYNFSLPHTALPQPGKARHQQERTQAMAVGLTNRVWRLEELLLIRVVLAT